MSEIEDDPITKEILETIEKLPYPEPSPELDRAMRARLDAIDAERSFWQRLVDSFTVPRMTFAAAALAAGVLILITLSGPRHEKASDDASIAGLEMEIAEDLDLLENYEVIENLDVLEDIDVILEMDDAG